MKLWVWKLGLAALGGAFVACGSNAGSETAGSSMETENSIALSVRLADGTPAARMKIFVRPEGYLPGAEGASVDSAMNANFNFETDDNGNVEFKSLEDGKYVVEARGESLKGIAKIEYDGQDSDMVQLDINVVKAGSVAGQVYLPEGVSSVSVGVEGMEYRVQTDTLGKFKFASLPAGELNMVAYVYDDSASGDDSKKLKNYGSISVDLAAGEQENVFIGDSAKMPKAFVFEDFENGVDNWYVFSSPYASGTVEMVDAGKGRDGKAAHFVCENDSNAGWVLMGASFVEVVNMSKLDSVVFWARGVRTKKDQDDLFIHFAFDAVPDSTQSFTEGKAWVNFDIDSAWTRFVVIPKNLLKPDSANTGGNIGWDSVKTNVNKFSIFGGVGGEFWFDDIEVYGVKEFLPKKQDPAKKEETEESEEPAKEDEKEE